MGTYARTSGSHRLDEQLFLRGFLVAGGRIPGGEPDSTTSILTGNRVRRPGESPDFYLGVKVFQILSETMASGVGAPLASGVHEPFLTCNVLCAALQGQAVMAPWAGCAVGTSQGVCKPSCGCGPGGSAPPAGGAVATGDGSFWAEAATAGLQGAAVGAVGGAVAGAMGGPGGIAGGAASGAAMGAATGIAGEVVEEATEWATGTGDYGQSHPEPEGAWWNTDGPPDASTPPINGNGADDSFGWDDVAELAGDVISWLPGI